MCEFDKQDQEAMDLANKGKRIATSPAAPRNDTEERRERCVRNAKAYLEQVVERNRKKHELALLKLRLLLKVLLCLLIAVAFLTSMVNPRAVVIVTNAGVLSCGCVIAVMIDRFFRRR